MSLQLVDQPHQSPSLVNPQLYKGASHNFACRNPTAATVVLVAGVIFALLAIMVSFGCSLFILASLAPPSAGSALCLGVLVVVAIVGVIFKQFLDREKIFQNREAPRLSYHHDQLASATATYANAFGAPGKHDEGRSPPYVELHKLLKGEIR